MRWRTFFGTYESKIRSTLLGILLASLVMQAGTAVMLYYAHKAIESELLSPLYESLDLLALKARRQQIEHGAVLDLSHGLDRHFEFALADTVAGAPATMWDQFPPAARRTILSGHTAKVRRESGSVVEIQLCRLIGHGKDARLVTLGRELVAYSHLLQLEKWHTISRTVGLLLLVAAIFLVTREMTRPFRLLRGVAAEARSSLHLKDKPGYEDWEEVIATFDATIAKLQESQAELQKRYVVSESERHRLGQFNQQVIQSIPAGLIAADPEGHIVQFNPALVRLPGAREPRPEENLRDYCDAWPELCTIFRDLPPERWTGHRGECQARFGEDIHFLEYDVLAVPGGGTLVLITDRTQLRRLEALLAQRARLAALGETAAGLAHELRNAMGAIVGYARLITKSSEESPANAAARIETEAGEMEAMLERFLEVARPATIQTQEITSTELLQPILSGYRTRLEEAGITLRFVSDRAVTLRLDPMWFKRAVANLLDNARQHLNAGGTITVDARAVQDEWRLTVSDDGPGIPPEWREKIFAPFVTLRPGGTGLGLALVQKVMTAHEGTVEVQKSAAGGASFVLTFPRALVERSLSDTSAVT